MAQAKSPATATDSEKLSQGLVALGILFVIAIVAYFILRWIAPASIMALVHVVTIPAYFVLWVVAYLVLWLVIYLVFSKSVPLYRTLLATLAAAGFIHLIAAGPLGELALYNGYGNGSLNNIPIPAVESIKLLPKDVAESRIKISADSSQLIISEIDEGIIVSQEGISHIAFIGFGKPNDLEGKFTSRSEIVVIDSHTEDKQVLKLDLKVAPGRSFTSDPYHVFYATISPFDGTSYPDGVVPIINESGKGPKIQLVMPVITPVTKWAFFAPVSNIPQFSGVVRILPETGEAEFLNLSQIKADPILSVSRLFPEKLALELAESSRFAGKNSFTDKLRTLLPSIVSSFGNYDLATDADGQKWPALYVSKDASAVMYFPFTPVKSTAVIREVAIDADSGKLFVQERTPTLVSPSWIISSNLIQRLNAEQILPGAYGKFGEPIPLTLKDTERFFVYPVTSSKGTSVMLYAVTTATPNEQGQVEMQFFSNKEELLKWLENPIFSSQNVRELFAQSAGVTTVTSSPIQQPNANTEIAELKKQLNVIEEKLDTLIKISTSTPKKN